MDNLEKIEKKQNFGIIIISGILSIIISKLPFGNFVLFPFSMFVTYLHESSHGLAAILTGGKLLSFTMQMDTSGLAYTQGGIGFIIVSAGYLGSAIWGNLLLIASIKKLKGKIILSILSLFFLLFTLLFARNLVAFFAGLFFATSIFLITKIKNNKIISFFLSFLAVQTCFNSINDIYDLIFLSRLDIKTDAHIISREMTAGIIPPIVFALLWIIISGIIFFFTLKISLKSINTDK